MITLGGTNFADSHVPMIGGVEATVDSQTSTSMTVTLPAMEQGTYALNVMVDASGYATRG